MKPLVLHENEIDINNSIQYNINQSFFLDPYNYRAIFQINDENLEVDDINISISYGEDFAHNTQDPYDETSFISLDTKNPSIIDFVSNTDLLNLDENLLVFQVLFDEEMNQNQSAQFNFYPIPTPPVVLQQTDLSWLDHDSLHVSYELISAGSEPIICDVNVSEATDLAGNLLTPLTLNELLTIHGDLNADEMDTKRIQLYPNLIAQGARIHFKNVLDNAFMKDCNLLASDGKFIKTLNMEKLGPIWTSEPINIPSGIYFIHINQQSFRLVVL